MSWAYKILAQAERSFLSEKVTESLVGNLCSCAQSVCCECSVLGSWHVVGVNCYANSKVKHINEIKWPIFKRGFQRLRPFLCSRFNLMTVFPFPLCPFRRCQFSDELFNTKISPFSNRGSFRVWRGGKACRQISAAGRVLWCYLSDPWQVSRNIIMPILKDCI